MIPDIAYLVLNYNPDGDQFAQNILSETLDRFYERKSKHLNCSVLVLDQGSPQHHRDWLRKKKRQYDFSLALLDQNIGISGAINLHARNAKSPVLGLITSDVIITRGMDEDLFKKVQIEEIYQATPFTDKSDLEYQTWHPAEEFGSPDVDTSALRNSKTRFWQALTGKETKHYLRVIGAELNIMFWRKDVFQKLGCFDERWKACYENNDFSLRCFLAGGCTALSMDSFVWHHHKVTEKNGSREKTYPYGPNWPVEIRRLWDQKWPDLNRYIDIYQPIRSKAISHYPALLEKFRHNIYLSCGQS